MRTTVFPGKRNFSLNGHGLSFLYGLLFAAAFVAALFFNGIRIEFFALSMALLVLLFLPFCGAVTITACISPRRR